MDGCLTGHEDSVVGLRVVAHHALLVALAVVDVHVQHPPVQQRLEVAHPVVAVDRDLRVELLVEVHELGELLGDEHRQAGRLLDDRARVGLTQHDGDAMDLIEAFEHRQPLQQLVDAGRVVPEVGDQVRLQHGRIVGPREASHSIRQQDFHSARTTLPKPVLLAR